MAVFDLNVFDPAIFDTLWVTAELDYFWASFMEGVGNMAEYLEHNPGPRPVFNCTKTQLRAEFTTLNALMPTTRAALKAAITLTPAGYQDLLVDHMLRENVSGYCRNGYAT